MKISGFFKTLVFNPSERTISIYSLTLSFASFVLSFSISKNPSPAMWLTDLKYLLIFFALLFLVIGLMIGISILNRKNEKINRKNIELEKKVKSQVTTSHRLVHDIKEKLFNLGDDEIYKKFSLKEKQEDIFRNVADSIVEKLRKQLKDFFRSRGVRFEENEDDVCVTIKRLILHEKMLRNLNEFSLNKANKKKLNKLKQNTRWVVTAYRDKKMFHRTKKNRDEIRQVIYTLNDNTAFKKLFVNHDKKFCCDDLVGLGQGYENETDGWEELYNSTIVVPIRYNRIDSEKYRYFGCLAVDSLNPEKKKMYELDECFEMVSCAADILAIYCLFSVLITKGNIYIDQ